MNALDIEDYLAPDETPLETADASLREVEAIEGTLACTSRRVVFLAEENVTDISADAVTALEFREGRYPFWNAVVGGVLAVVGAFLLLVAGTGSGVPVTSVLGGAAFLVGGIVLGLGLRDRAATLELHTAGRSFEFAGEDDALAAFPAAIRRKTS